MDAKAETMPDIHKLLCDLKDDNLMVSRDAMIYLLRSEDVRAVGPLLEYLADKHRISRGEVAGRLWRFDLNRQDRDRVLKALIELMADGTWSVRYGAYWAFVGMREARAIPAMIALLKHVASGNEEVDENGVNDDYSTYSMLSGIGEMCERVGDTSLFGDAIEPLRHFLNDPREKARRNAAKSLVCIGAMPQ